MSTEKHRESSRAYYYANRETILEKEKQKRLANPDKLKERRQKQRLATIEQHKARRKKAYWSNPEEARAKSLEYYYNHKDELREKAREYKKKRMRSNVQARLRESLRNLVSSTLKRRGILKRCSAADLIGCSIVELKHHIEKQFYPDMSWEERNFHIDHIVPCALFDLSDHKQQKACFHYSNLRPLPPSDNLHKSSSITLEALPLLPKLQPRYLCREHIPEYLLQQLNETDLLWHNFK